MFDLGHIHYIRFCRRADIEMSVWNSCGEVEDFNTSGRNAVSKDGNDTFMIAKRWMADRDVIRVVAIFPAATVQKIRAGFHLPDGVESRRVIGPQVKANIERYVPQSMKKGELPQNAAKYLLHWCRGTLAPLPRPLQYSILNYRIPDFRGEFVHHGSWSKPSRFRHIDLTIDGPGGDDTESDSEGEVNLPRALANS